MQSTGQRHQWRLRYYAAEIAKKNNAQLTALTITHSSLSSFGLAASPDSSKQAKEKDVHESKQWFDKVNEIAKKEGVQLRNELIDTQISVEAAIVEYAEQTNIDLIIIGTRGRSGFKRMLLGSVASGVVTYATCPVMVVK